MLATELSPSPPIPKEVANAAQSGQLVVFVGAGISRLVNCPSWEDLSRKILNQIVPDGLNHYEVSQILSISDPKKKLSIARIVSKNNGIDLDYKSLFPTDCKTPNIYTYLNKFECAFVTTNYDTFLHPELKKLEPQEKWRFYKVEDILREKADVNGNVIHLHGCIEDYSSMVITTRDYIDHYSKAEIQEFLTYLFKSKTVLFLGYGLEEIEVLEYILRIEERSIKSSIPIVKRFILQGFFKAEQTMFNIFKEYYREAFDADLVGFIKDYNSYEQQIEILENWSNKAGFGTMALTDEANALREEIGD